MKEIENSIHSCTDLKELEKLRVSLFGKKGYFAQAFAKMKSLSDEEKKILRNKLIKKKKIF